MATLFELAFANGDLVPVQVSPGVWDLAVVSDNEAVIQDATLNLNLQKGFNQYFPDAGWDLLKFYKADLAQADIDEICREVKLLAERIDFVVSATCTYLGQNQVGSQFEQAFKVTAVTTFGTLEVPFALGGASS